MDAKTIWIYLGLFLILVNIKFYVLVILFASLTSIASALVAFVIFNSDTIAQQRDILTRGTVRFLVDFSPIILRRSAEQTIDYVQQNDRKILLDRIMEWKSAQSDADQLVRLSDLAASKQACLSYKVGESSVRFHEPPKGVPTGGNQRSRARRNHDDKSMVSSSVITGDPIIDAQINELLALIFRDHILTWYRLVSESDNEFVLDLYDVIKYFIKSLSKRMQSINTVGYITTKLVDDFASHLRLYRIAKTKLEADTRQPTNPEELARYNKKLYDYFFDHEYQMEKNICRDHVCQVQSGLYDYINQICDILQYLLLPIDCFMNRPLRVLIRSILSNSILKPLLDLVSEPDYLNRMIVWLCKAYSGSTDTFILVLRNSENEQELWAVLNMVKNEIVVLRGKDTGGQDDHEVKQRLNSLLYVESLLKQKIVASSSPHHSVRKLPSSQFKLFHDHLPHIGPPRGSELVPQLSLQSIMVDQIALSHFIEFMSSIDAQNYTYFYLNVEGFKISAEHQLEEAQLGSTRALANLEALREAASDIHRNYLDAKGRANFKLNIKDQDMIDRLQVKIRTAAVDQHWFDEVQRYVFEMMRDDSHYYKAFCRSAHYSYLLKDLGLVRAPPVQTSGHEPATKKLTKSDSMTSLSQRLFQSFNDNDSMADTCNSKVAAALDVDSEDNIALRVLLLLMDEVFDLKAKAVWLRRQIMSFLRTLLHVTLGDKMNRKIVEYVGELTKPAAIAGYLKTFKDSFWPNGRQASFKPKRDQEIKLRTRVAAKYLMLCSLPDELKKIIGAETTRQGLMLVFEMFQHETLNRRLILVLIESFLKALFPTGHFDEVFRRLHSKSQRTNHQRRGSIKENRAKSKVPGHRRSASSSTSYYKSSPGSDSNQMAEWPPGLTSLGHRHLMNTLD